MSQLVHSPPPWRCSTHGSGPDCTDILSSDDALICDVLDRDAPLISAAPDLLEALKAMRDIYTGGAVAEKRYDVFLQAVAAISKAEGKA